MRQIPACVLGTTSRVEHVHENINIEARIVQNKLPYGLRIYVPTLSNNAPEEVTTKAYVTFRPGRARHDARALKHLTRNGVPQTTQVIVATRR